MAKTTDIITIARKLLQLQKVIADSKKGKKAKSETLKVRKPKPIRAAKGFGSSDLLGLVDHTRKHNAVRDKVTLIGYKPNKKGDTVVTKTLTYDNTGAKLVVRPHTQWVKKKDPEADAGKKLTKSKLLVSCNCEDFMFTWEYALHHHGAATIRFCNGEYPILKNPKLYPGICKHLFVVLHYIRHKNI